jgi:hypothetical protein
LKPSPIFQPWIIVLPVITDYLFPGASPNDIIQLINAFYAQADPNSASNAEAEPSPRQTVDSRFQEKVWTWITRDSEVKVLQGKNARKASIALPEAEALDGAPNDNDTDLQPNENAIRLNVSEERTWHAVAGHGPDLKKVPQMDFVLLSIIAGRREKGILQGDLTRLSGQDKRSVPSRTQRLADRGYIEKRSVKAKGNKTSLLIHRRYQGVNSTQERREVEVGFVDFGDLLEKIFDVLRVERIMTHNDLKTRLNMDEPRRAKALSRSIRKLERIGVVKRVRAESALSKMLGTVHKCVKLIREPDLDRDLKLFHQDRKRIQVDRLGSVDSDSEGEDEAGEEDADEEIQRSDGQLGSRALREIEVDRTLPDWTSDRQVNNIIYDVIHRSGLRGVTQWVSWILSCGR